jgi:hypothetical protein
MELVRDKKVPKLTTCFEEDPLIVFVRFALAAISFNGLFLSTIIFSSTKALEGTGVLSLA